MNCPKYLTGEAKDFWKKHAKQLREAGMLSERDEESFALLCEIWRLIRITDPTIDSKHAMRYMALCKNYLNLAKQFGVVPKDRKQSKIELSKPQGADEFGL